MASTKKPSNTSKTAHVMNLLSKGRDPAAPADPPEAAAAADAAPVPKPESVAPPIITTFASDAAISSQIKEALEDAFADELGIVREDAQETSPDESTAEPAADAAAPEIPQPAVLQVPPTTYVNIMQVLVEENAQRYMQMLDVCPCSRCTADVKALALNELQPKYVVMPEGEMIPRITVYEGQFRSTVTAQLLRACEHVKTHPRHNL